jgi:hypothetical protein
MASIHDACILAEDACILAEIDTVEKILCETDGLNGHELQTDHCPLTALSQ